jgi:RsiW-degrading membrane proteinase PrsW (M82 family)
MDWSLLAKVLVAVAPVMVLLVVFERLDVFRMVSGGAVVAYTLAGAALAALSYVSNAHVMDGLPIGFTDYSRYVAPVVEEVLKGLVIVGLFATDRVGFKLDAAIAGFAVGAGFSVFENVYLLSIFPGAGMGVWLVRGFGAAIMHGGATALFAVITHEFSEHRAHREGRHARLYPWVFAPGLLVAIAVHSAFNHLPGRPMLAMVAAMVLIPLTLLVIFAKGGATAHDWLEHDHEGHAALLADLRAGRFAHTEEGQALLTTAQRFPPRIAEEIREWIELQLALVLRAEEVLLARERDEHLEIGPTEREQFNRLDSLGRHIGRAARHTIRPHLPFSRSDLYELHMLRHRAGV